jgi:dipeptidyl aminopeptidase/acylaminoacyl peptidase
MPWNGTELFLAEVLYSDDGPPVFKNVQGVAGGKLTAIFQPEFSPDSRRIVWLSDETGWHNFYARDLKSGTTRQLTQENKAQLGTPAWLQGARTYGFSHDGRQIHFLRNERGFSTLCSLDGRSGKISVDEELKKEYSDLKQIACNPKDGRIALIASSGTCPARVIVLCATGGLPTSASVGQIYKLETASEAKFNSADESASCNRTGRQGGCSAAETSGTQNGYRYIIVKRSSSESASKNELVEPCAISWKGPRSTSIHGLLYLPKSIGESSGKKNAPKPPAIIRIHGGPTTQSLAAYSGDIQFFVTRGYTVLDVNYRGSTGYGRKYMDELRGNWGVCDVQDAMSGAKFLIQRGWADAKKMVIMGGSAGGYTVLQSLVDFPGFYKAGVCLYGISNQFTLVSDTHKFEERYSDYLLGSLPEAAVKYRDRSPVFKSERIVDPVAVFQGEIDEVVPKSQSEAIVASLKTRNVPHEYHVYAGEGHGWRKSETIESFYKSVEAFLKNNVLFS